MIKTEYGIEGPVETYRLRMNRLCDAAAAGNPMAQYVVNNASLHLDRALAYAEEVGAVRMVLSTPKRQA